MRLTTADQCGGRSMRVGNRQFEHSQANEPTAIVHDRRDPARTKWVFVGRRGKTCADDLKPARLSFN